MTDLKGAGPLQKALFLVCAGLLVSLAVVLLLPNPNLPFEDDLALFQLAAWPVFLGVAVPLYRWLARNAPPQPALLVTILVLGAFHTMALLLHSTGAHDLNLLLERTESLDTRWGRTQQGIGRGGLRRTRHFADGSGSYVFEWLSPETGASVVCSYSGNRPTGPLPNWIVPLRVEPWSFRPQYWVSVNQRAPRQSLLLRSKVEGDFEQNPGAFLPLALFLLWMPYLVAWHWQRPRLAWGLLAAWALLYQPWQAWLW